MIYPFELIKSCSNDSSVLSYLALTPRPIGKLDLNKAKELGVPQGKLLGKLKAGEAVDIGNGTIILP